MPWAVSVYTKRDHTDYSFPTWSKAEFTRKFENNVVNLKKQSISNYENLYFCCLSTHRPDVTFGSIRVLILNNEKITLIDTVFNHNHYNFLKYDWCISCFIFQWTFCRGVIGQLAVSGHLVINQSDSASRSSDFVNRSYNYRTNWTPLGPITIINT